MRRGDHLYGCPVIAFRPKTGEMVWHCQFSPNDPDDHAATEVGLLVDIKIDGPPRQVLAQVNRNGFFSVLDRVNGKLLVRHPYVKANAADKIDLAPGRPVECDVTKRAHAGEGVEVWSSLLGGSPSGGSAWTFALP